MGRHSGIAGETRELFEARFEQAMAAPAAGRRVAARRAERMADAAAANPVPAAPAPVADTPSEAGMLSLVPESSTFVGTQTTGVRTPGAKRSGAAVLALAAAASGVAAVGTSSVHLPHTSADSSNAYAALGTSKAPSVDNVAAGKVSLAVRVDGEVRSLETNALTVGDALAEAGIVVGEADRVSVSLASPVIEGSEVSIVRVEVRTVTEEKAQAFESVREDDASLAKGTEKVATEGVDGLVRETYEVTFEDGQEVGRELVLSTQVREKVDEVIKVGTKEASTTQAATSQGSSVANVEIASVQSAPATTVASGTPQQIAHAKVLARGWGEDQFSCLVTLWNRESNWNPYARNAYSGAYGIPQALPGSKMASAGADWATNPATQIEWGLGYISGRYGTPCNALGHSYSVGWY